MTKDYSPKRYIALYIASRSRCTESWKKSCHASSTRPVHAFIIPHWHMANAERNPLIYTTKPKIKHLTDLTFIFMVKWNSFTAHLTISLDVLPLEIVVDTQIAISNALNLGVCQKSAIVAIEIVEKMFGNFVSLCFSRGIFRLAICTWWFNANGWHRVRFAQHSSVRQVDGYMRCVCKKMSVCATQSKWISTMISSYNGNNTWIWRMVGT